MTRTRSAMPAIPNSRLVAALGLCALLLVSSGCAGVPPLNAWFVDSLAKVFPDDRMYQNRLREAKFEAARGAHLSIQLALRSDSGMGDLYVDALALTGPGMPIETLAVRRVEYVVVTSNTRSTPDEELVRRAPALFPDALLGGFPMTLEKGKTRAVWITLAVPHGQTPGTYHGTLVVRQGTEQLIRLPYTVEVKKAVIPAGIPLAVSNHFNFSDGHLEQFYGCSRYSGAWWDVIANHARFLSGYYQTSIAANPVTLASARPTGGGLAYDFSNFVRFIQTFEAAGVKGHIEGGNLLFRERRRDAPIMVPAWVNEGGSAVLRNVSLSDPRASQFLNSFLPALYKAVVEHGWKERYLQSILDEPEPWEAAAFVSTAALVRKLMPGITVMEPVDAAQDLSFLEKTADIWVVQLGTFDDRMELLRKHIDAGGQLWFYTALAPRGKYPNRFIDYSLLKTRILHWMNFKHGFRGYLHWGGNYWGPEPRKDTQPVINEGRTYLPPGDAYITYPNVEGRSVHSSIRLEQMREGIEDYALLCELAKSDPNKAAAISGQAVRGFTGYVRDPAEFRAIHRSLLDSF